MIVVGVMLVPVIWLIDAQPRDGAREREQAAIGRMLVTVIAAEDGARVDLATAFDLPWDRAVLIEPYSDGAAMNRQLGFEWYEKDSISSTDAAQFVVFVRGQTVVADTVLHEDMFQFDDEIASFARSEAEFVVVRENTSGSSTLSRP